MILFSSEKRKKYKLVKDLDLNHLNNIIKESKDNEKKLKLQLVSDMTTDELKSLITTFGSDNKVRIRKLELEAEKRIIEELEIEAAHEEIKDWGNKLQERKKREMEEIKSINLRKGEKPSWFEHLPIEPVDKKDDSSVPVLTMDELVEKYITSKNRKPEDYQTAIDEMDDDGVYTWLVNNFIDKYCPKIKNTVPIATAEGSYNIFNFAKYGDPSKTKYIQDHRLRRIAKNIDKMYFKKSKLDLALPEKVTFEDIKAKKMESLRQILENKIEQHLEQLAVSYVKISKESQSSNPYEVAEEMLKRLIQ